MGNVLIVDGAYLLKAAKPFGHFDYNKLRSELEGVFGYAYDEAYYFGAVRDADDASQDGFHTFLKSAPPRGPKFRVQLYELKGMTCECPECHHRFEREVQKGVDVGIATLVLKLAIRDKYEELTLCAGDGDFEDAVRYVIDERGKTLNLVGFTASLSTDLQSYARRVVFLNDHWQQIQRV